MSVPYLPSTYKLEKKVTKGNSLLKKNMSFTSKAVSPLKYSRGHSDESGVVGCCCSDGFLGPFHLKVKEGGEGGGNTYLLRRFTMRAYQAPFL